MAEESTSKVRFKFTRKKILAVIFILAIPFIYYFLARYVLPITSWNYEGHGFVFSTNLRDAQNVPIITNYQNPKGADYSVMDALVRDDVQNITFLFVPTDSTNNTLYILEKVDIMSALRFAYAYSPNLQLHVIPNFDTQEISSYSNITATQLNPKIVLVHPNFSNETAVRQDGYIIYVEGKNTNNFKTDRVQFDLAAARLMMAILSIKIQ